MIKTITFKTRIRLILSKVLGKDFSHIPNSLVRDSRIISFDVFDTLIIRPGLKTPSDLFDLIHPEDPTFKARRLEAVGISRLEAEAKGLEDRTLTDIYKHLPEYDEKDEINAELSVCKANPEALKFFNTVKKAGKAGKDSKDGKAGKRVVIISDMYLDRPTIENILTNSGFELEGVNVYVSSEYGLTKRSGNLFKKVLREEGMVGREGEVLHIGDHFISDYLNPRKCGMKSFLYNRCSQS